jgi:hypothetical protein
VKGVDVKWINSAGGPLICAEEHIANEWAGLGGLSAGFDDDCASDYERACASRAYVEAIACGVGSVLVLGDEPLQSSFFRTGDGALAIARWVYAQSNDDRNIAEFLSRSTADQVAPSISFSVVQGTLLLFDSALRGADELVQKSTSVELEPGPYLVTSERYQLDGKYSFIVHRLLAAKN